MKKIISILLSVLFILSTMTMLTFTVNAQDLQEDTVDVLEYEEMEDGSIKITKYDSLEAEFEVPSEIDGKTVTVIGKKAFYSCHVLKKIIIPDTITTIEDRAFDSCQKLTTVVMSNSLTSLGYKAFSDCKSLSSINIPYGVTTIGNNCFTRCFALKSIEIPETVTSIGNSAFSDCTALASVTLNNGEVTIGEYAFAWCMRLEEITIGSNAVEMKNYAFYACDALKSITIKSKDCVIYDSVDTISGKAVIYGYDNSTAHEYALKYDREFVLLEKEDIEYKIGDVDLDGEVTIMDATIIQQHVASQFTLTGDALLAADTDKSGSVSVLDATTIQRFLAKIIIEF